MPERERGLEVRGGLAVGEQAGGVLGGGREALGGRGVLARLAQVLGDDGVVAARCAAARRCSSRRRARPDVVVDEGAQLPWENS